MTGAEDVVEVLESLTVAHVPWWVAGGWGVDALVGEQTRMHDDVDVMVPGDALPTAEACLAALHRVCGTPLPPGVEEDG
jgi:lincosamide nucleotidyltransferase A/C/D/E